jgi:hypothetical protein
MKLKSALKLSFFAMFVMLLLHGCDDDVSSFGEDFEGNILPTDLAYTEILNAREFSYVESSVPFINSNGHPVNYEVVNVKKDDVVLDDSYLSKVSILNPVYSETEHPDTGDLVKTYDVSTAGKVIIEDENPFGYGDYYFTIKAKVWIENAEESVIFEDALHLNIGPGLANGISYCPFKMNFASGENTTSEPIQLFGGNPDIRFELGSDADKLSINANTGAITLNSSYSISGTETINPVINVVSNISEEVVSFEGAFTAILSSAPIELDKEADYFFFPKLQPTAKNNVPLGGNGYSYQVVDYHTDGAWFNNNAFWRAQQGKKWIAPVPTADAVAVRNEAGVGVTRTLEVPFWTIEAPSESWIIMDSQNLALYEGCFDSKAVFWYKLFLNDFACYELDGSTPIGLEVHITNNYTGDVTATDWTQVNDILECEINDNGTVFRGTPYPGDQTGANPDGLKDPVKNANNLWVRGELDLEDYKTEESFTLAFRLKTYFETEPNCPVNGGLQLSNVHFVASEK